MMDFPEGQSDAELLRLAIAGDEHAFLLLYGRLKTSIFRYAFYMTASKTAAEEIVQEVFIALLKNGDRYKATQGDVSAFVFGIARNLVRRFKRNEYLREELPGDEALNKLSTVQFEAEGLSERMIRDQSLKKIHAAIASLPDHYRQVVVLCDLCELTYAEAASRLRCAVGTVRSRLSRAHDLLTQKLRPAKKAQPGLSAAGTEECLI